MPYDMSWYLEKRIVFINFHETMQLDEMPSMFEALEDFRQAGEDPVHIIADVSRMERFPMAISEVGQLAPLMDTFGVCVIYGVSQPLLQFVLKVVAKVIKLELRVAETLELALISIGRLDPTLSHLAE
jgi:hypothetical protein